MQRACWRATPATRLVLVTLVAMPLLARPQITSLTDREVDAAIALGRRGQSATVRLDGGAGSFVIKLAGPFARVAEEAAFAVSENRPFTRDDVTDNLRAPILTITAEPAPPVIEGFRGTRFTDIPLALVIQPKAHEVAPIQPIATRTYEWRWHHPEGADVTGRSLAADFYLAMIPPGDFDVVVTTGEGPKRWTVKEKHRQRIR